MEKLVIDRSKWIRGIEDKAKLLDEKGNMCCLGFECIRQGFPSRVLLDELTPEDAANNDKREVANLALITLDVTGAPLTGDDWRAHDTGMASRLMGINDDTFMSDAQREEAIQKEFAEVGVQVEFVGEGNPYQAEIEEQLALWAEENAEYDEDENSDYSEDELHAVDRFPSKLGL